MSERNEYDSLLSYEGGNDFFETVLGGLAKVQYEDSDSNSSSSDGSNSSSSSDSTSGSDSGSEDQSPMMDSKTHKRKDIIDDFIVIDKVAIEINNNEVNGENERSPLFDSDSDEKEEKDERSPLFDSDSEDKEKEEHLDKKPLSPRKLKNILKKMIKSL